MTPRKGNGNWSIGVAVIGVVVAVFGLLSASFNGSMSMSPPDDTAPLVIAGVGVLLVVYAVVERRRAG